VGHHPGGQLEPESRQRGEHLPLARYARGQHAVERRNAVGSHDQQLVAQVVRISNLAPAKHGQREISLEHDGSFHVPHYITTCRNRRRIYTRPPWSFCYYEDPTA